MKKWLIEDVIATVGYNADGLRVVWIRGIGEWVCPPRVYFTKVGTDRFYLTYPKAGVGDYRKTIYTFDPASIKSVIEIAVKTTSFTFGLYKKPVTVRELNYHPREKRPFKDRPGFFSVTIAKSLYHILGNKPFRCEYTRPSDRADALSRASAFAESQQKLIQTEVRVPSSYFLNFK